MKDDRVYLEHILECTDWVFRHTAEGKWEIVDRDLPVLRVAVEAMRQETEDGRT